MRRRTVLGALSELCWLLSLPLDLAAYAQISYIRRHCESSRSSSTHVVDVVDVVVVGCVILIVGAEDYTYTTRV